MTVDFSQAVFLMTTNDGSKEIEEKVFSWKAQRERERERKRKRESLRGTVIDKFEGIKWKVSRIYFEKDWD